MTLLYGTRVVRGDMMFRKVARARWPATAVVRDSRGECGFLDTMWLAQHIGRPHGGLLTALDRIIFQLHSQANYGDSEMPPSQSGGE
jgi:diadenosine tetraphosphatase ApaH/serine/threonine PP2A family protein phosphatase